MRAPLSHITAVLSRRLRRPAVALFALAALAMTLTIGCAQGSYPIDIFYEMHYQPSHHSQEPPRLMPPAGSVPITGKETPIQSLVSPENIDSLTNPIPGQGLDEGAQLYSINCAMCHGDSGIGDGHLLETMTEKYGYTPKLNTNLTLVNVFGYTDGFVFATITDRDMRPEIASLPAGSDLVMPQFRKLLTEEERWMLVNYVQTLGAP